MNRLAELRLLSWSLPMALVYGAVLVRRPSRREMAGALVAIVWTALSLIAVNEIALRLGWWEFAPGLPSLLGVPIEPLLGWTLLWAGVAIAFFERPLIVAVLGLLWADLILMPVLHPLLVLGRWWLVGEGVAVVAGLLPALLFARWTATRTNLEGRVVMQVVTTGGLLLWLVPAAAIQFGGGWSHVVATIGPSQVGVGVQVALVPLAMGLRAVMEFLRRGGGTPIPYDPPIALVESGPYAYLRNPMQAAIVAFFVIAAAFLRNVALLGAGAFAFAYSAGLAEWHENGQLLDRFGEGWVRYRAHVRAWVPRCRPYVRRNSTLYVAFTCGTCSSVGRWFLARHPIGLEIAPAEAALGKIRRRVTYVSPSGSSSEGIAAIAHALEHIHIGWAAVGWLLMLPGIRHVAQLLADVCGPGPQVVAGRTYEPNVCETGS